jgi:hypothetical protein
MSVTYPLTPALCLAACWLDDAPARVTAPREQVVDLNRMRAGSAERFLYADRESADIAELARAVPDPPPMLQTSGLGRMSTSPRSR